MASTFAVVATTLQKAIPEVRDSTMVDLALMGALKKMNTLNVTDEVGDYLHIPVVVKDHSQSTHIGDTGGFTRLDSTYESVERKAQWEYEAYVSKVGISRMEAIQNKGSRVRLVNTGELRLKQTIERMTREWEAHVLIGLHPDGTATRFTDLASFQGVTDTNGFFEEVAFASQSNTVGGLARGDYGVLGHQYVSAGGTLAANQLDQLIRYTGGYGPLADLIICNGSVFDLERNAGKDKQRFTGNVDKYKFASDAQTMVLTGGTIVRWSPFMDSMPDGGTAANAIQAYAVCTDDLHPVFAKDAYFSEADDWSLADDYNVKELQLMTICALGASRFRNMGALILGS